MAIYDERRRCCNVEIIRGKQPSAQRVCIYGPEGIGKSTLASQFPDPLFIDTEGGTKQLDVARTQQPADWGEFTDQIRYVFGHPDICSTLIIDTIDWAEQLAIQHVCDKYNKTGIEDFGFGKGFTYLAEEIGELLRLLSNVMAQGIHVVLVAHAWMRKFDQPDEMGSYDRWEMKLQKKTAPLIKEWADMVLFLNYRTIVVTDTNGKAKGQGGKRMMFASHHPCWDAKNRHGLKDEMPMEYKHIAHCFLGENPADKLITKMQEDGIEASEIETLMKSKGHEGPVSSYTAEAVALLLDNWTSVTDKIQTIREDN